MATVPEAPYASSEPVFGMRRYVGLLVGLTCGGVSTARADPARLAWIGLERGPLPPKEAEQLEKLLIDELDGYESFRLVDASGHALDARLLASEAALVARLKDDAINLALEFKTAPALKKFDQAIAVFETRLIQLLDYELFHDTLLAKAEAQFQSGNKAAAKATLKQLAALSPAKEPTAKTHPPGLVKLWQDAQEDLGDSGTLDVTCEGCTVQLDGQVLGPAPLTTSLIPPGKHYLVARWTRGYVYEAVQVAAGLEAKIHLERKGPAEEAREALLSAIDRRAGISEAAELAAHSTKMAQGDGALIAAIKSDADGKRWLVFAQHGADGEAIAIAKAPFDAAVEDERTSAMVKRIGALIFVDRKRGEHVLAADGTSSPGEKLADLLYGGKASAIVEAPPPPPPIAPPPPELEPDPELDTKVEIAAETKTETETSIVDEWWFWTLLAGAVAIGAGVGVGIWAGTRNPSTTEFEVILP